MLPELEAPHREAVKRYIENHEGVLKLAFKPSNDSRLAFLTLFRTRGAREIIALEVTTDAVTLERMQQPSRLPKILIYGPEVTPAQTAEEIFSFLNEHYPDLNINRVDLYDIPQKGHPNRLASISKKRGLSLYNS